MTSNQEPPSSIERLRQDLNGLNEARRLQTQKLSRLRNRRVAESNEATRFQLDQEIETEGTHLNQLDKQIDQKEQELEQAELRQSQNRNTQQNLPNTNRSQSYQQNNQTQAESPRNEQSQAEPPTGGEPPTRTDPWSYLKALIIRVYTRNKKLITIIVYFLCGFTVVLSVVFVWNIWSSSQQVCESPAADVSDIDFSPDGKYLATASLDKTVQILKVTETRDQKNEIRACQRETQGVVAVKFSPARRYLATASLDSASLWKMNDNGTISSKHQDLSHDKILPKNEKYKNAVVAIDFSQDENYLATASADGEIKVWNMKNLKDVKALPTPQGQRKAYIVSVSFSHDGNYIATTDVNGEANVWELKADGSTFTPQWLKSIPDVTDVAFSLKNEENKIHLATASVDGTIQLWDVPGFQNSVPPNLKHNTYVRDVSFSPGRKFIAAIGLDKKVSLWDRETQDVAIPSLAEKSLLNNTNVVAIAFSLDDKYLAVAHSDGKVRIWNTIDKKEEDPLTPKVNGLVTVAFSPKSNGEYLAMAGADGQIEIKKFERK